MSKFSPDSPPREPIEPNKTIQQRDVIDCDILSDGDGINISRIPTGTDRIVLECTGGGYDEIRINVNYMSATKEVENPKYQKQYYLYLVRLAHYKLDIEEWNKLKKEYDAAKLKQDKDEWVQYKKLKAKFESVN